MIWCPKKSLADLDLPDGQKPESTDVKPTLEDLKTRTESKLPEMSYNTILMTL